MSNQFFQSQVRNATFVGDDNKKVPGNMGCHIYLNVTVVPGVDTVQLVIEGKDVLSGAYETILTGAARVAPGLDAFTIFPGVTETANIDISDPLPDVYRIRVVHSAGTNFTYSVSIYEIGG